MSRTALYRHFDADGALLYVGVTNNPKRRLAEHKCRAVWSEQIAKVSVKWVRDRESALEAEREIISGENPIFNGGNFDREDTGDAYRDWMNSASLRQSDLAGMLGISDVTLSQISSGKRKMPLRAAVFIEDLSNGVVPVRYWMFGATLENHANSIGFIMPLPSQPGRADA